MRKQLSPLASLVNNYQNFNYIHIFDPKFKNLVIERANYKNIYIYYIDRNTYDFIFLYNKSNKFYRLMIRADKSTKSFMLVNDFFDNKVKDYFLFDDFFYCPREQYELNIGDIDIIETLKRIDA